MSEGNGVPLDSVALREVKHLREMTELRFDALNKAVDLQAAEYERRLQELNHEAMRNAGVLAQTVTREAYEQYLETQRDQDAAKEMRADEKAEALKEMVRAAATAVEAKAVAAASAVEVKANSSFAQVHSTIADISLRIAAVERVQNRVADISTGGQTVEQAAVLAQQARQRLWLAVAALSLTVVGLVFAIVTR